MKKAAACPQCNKQVLYPLQFEKIQVDCCKKCGGLWFDQGELCQALKQTGIELPAPKFVPDLLASRLEETNWQCPSCNSPLTVYNLSEKVRLEIHACEKCNGLWLEKGELEHLRLLQDHEKAAAAINGERTWKNWLFQFVLAMPVEFNIKPKRFPIITVSLILLCLAVYVLEYSLYQTPDIFFQAWGHMPQTFPSLSWFVTLITCQFLHNGYIHLLGNMYFLYILGDNVEDVLGRWRYLFFYVACGIVAVLAFSLTTPNRSIVLVGASGAIAGIMAAYLVYFRSARLTVMIFVLQFKIPAYLYLAGWLALNIVGYLSGSTGVAWSAHLGGFATGLVIALAVKRQILIDNPILNYLAENAPPREIKETA